MTDMRVTLGPLTFRNPVLTASGTYGFGAEYAPYCQPGHLGAIMVKGITPQARLGNPPPRLAETPAGLLNAVGLENPGLEKFVKSYLPRLRELATAVVVNIAGFSIDDYALLARALDGLGGVDALEVNISCPNVERGGLAFGADPASAEAVLRAVRESTSLPLIAKLSPNVTDIQVMVRAAERGGADIISLINTITGMAIDVQTRRPVLGNITGGLSGPAVKPVALRMVYQAYEATRLPIIGMGGISDWKDGVEFLLAGASAVAVGTANFTDPRAPLAVLRGMDDYCRENGFARVTELVGLAHARSGK
ncbi:MAG: dihydroorotate dehydrogenase [Gracilibacteraceae bacterium]|jgi:dihydroorotate dehydrogenase (NAD+) catalytic subunit|nr:dihydroorotate dehydrogenase [Gracilibacteraceae bacterium]